jgi:hypothetical protein
MSADSSTPWHKAAAEGHAECVQLLVQVSRQGARSNTFNPTAKALNQADEQGQTPLMLACKGGLRFERVACATFVPRPAYAELVSELPLTLCMLRTSLHPRRALHVR